MNGDAFLGIAHSVECAARLPAIIACYQQIALIDDLAIAYQRRTFAMRAIVRPNHNLGYVVGRSKQRHLAVKAHRSAMYPSRIGILRVDHLQIGRGGSFVAVSCKRNVHGCSIAQHCEHFPVSFNGLTL